MQQVNRDEEALRFFNTLMGRLNIRLSEPGQPMSERLLNKAAPPSARIEEVSLTMRVLEETGEDGRNPRVAAACSQVGQPNLLRRLRRFAWRLSHYFVAVRL